MFLSQYFKFSLSVSMHHCPHSFINLPQTQQNVFLPGLQFSPVRIIAPFLHTHSFVYHTHCTMMFSQHFSFPLSVSFHHCSILIPSSTTLYYYSVPVFQFSPVSIIPPLLHTHSFIYHPHCIMFFSQYLRFPLSVSFHHCSILIHPSTTHAV